MEDFELQIIFEDNILYIGTECSSGCNYKCDSMEAVKQAIIDYIDSYL